jgi:hypothetical protein
LNARREQLLLGFGIPLRLLQLFLLCPLSRQLLSAMNLGEERIVPVDVTRQPRLQRLVRVPILELDNDRPAPRRPWHQPALLLFRLQLATEQQEVIGFHELLERQELPQLASLVSLLEHVGVE